MDPDNLGISFYSYLDTYNTFHISRTYPLLIEPNYI
jgi:hypothetical protein